MMWLHIVIFLLAIASVVNSIMLVKYRVHLQFGWKWYTFAILTWIIVAIIEVMLLFKDLGWTE